MLAVKLLSDDAGTQVEGKSLLVDCFRLNVAQRKRVKKAF